MPSNKPTEVDSMNRLRVQAENKAALYRRALVLACNGDEDQVAYFVSEAGTAIDAERECRECAIQPCDTCPDGVMASDAARVQRLRDALEGECAGLSIDEHHARAVLEYVDGAVGINGLTEAETSATASVMGIVGVAACDQACRGNDSESHCVRTNGPYCGVTNPNLAAGMGGTDGC